MSIKTGTYLVTFYDGTQIVCGNNYKSWDTHATEYASWCFGRWGKGDMSREQIADHIERVEYSEITFVDDGGLKYATPKAYDEVIDEMNGKDGGKRIPFKHIAFHSSNADKNKLEKRIKSL